MQDKKVLIKVDIFSKLLLFYKSKYQLTQGSTHLLITQEVIIKALLYQSVKKVTEPNIYNFWALQLI